MALTKGTNSYATVSEADSYFGDRLDVALRLILDVGMDYGALGGLVSGSGPTVAFLAEDEEHSLDLIVALKTSGVVGNVLHVGGPVHGARVIETL